MATQYVELKLKHDATCIYNIGFEMFQQLILNRSLEILATLYDVNRFRYVHSDIVRIRYGSLYRIIAALM